MPINEINNTLLKTLKELYLLPKASVIMNVNASADTRIPTISASQKWKFCVPEAKIECYLIQIWDQGYFKLVPCIELTQERLC